MNVKRYYMLYIPFIVIGIGGLIFSFIFYGEVIFGIISPIAFLCGGFLSGKFSSLPDGDDFGNKRKAFAFFLTVMLEILLIFICMALSLLDVEIEKYFLCILFLMFDILCLSYLLYLPKKKAEQKK